MSARTVEADLQESGDLLISRRVTRASLYPGAVPDLVCRDILVRLSGILEDQVAILRRIDERQNASDASRQHPITEVLATIGSAWNALLRSTLTETIQPKVERWRSGLDALLVFMGLFSGIVTSFFVPSLSSLQEDPAVRMNALLANLTDVVVALNGVPPASLTLAHPHPFKLDPTAVRLNSYWSFSLILSVRDSVFSCASVDPTVRSALYRSARGRLPRPAQHDVVHPLQQPRREVDRHSHALGVLGAVSRADDRAAAADPRPPGAALHRRAARHALLQRAAALSRCHPHPLHIGRRAAVHRLRRLAPAVDPRSAQPQSSRAPRPAALCHGGRVALGPSASGVPRRRAGDARRCGACNASAALYQIMQTSAPSWSRYGRGLAGEERHTLLHLLSPEASVRSSRAAVQIIISRVHDASRLQYSAAAMCALVPAFIDAARREPRADLWSPPFTRAMAIVANAGSVVDAYPPVLCIMTSEYIDVSQLPTNSNPS
ncbi:unnamed protein product [Mycena citricolor]|uniref:DUF6535 domain-containing protein n=1 Tax=Mycena citricolor TaxID=2018698 RepID=A0AAD2HT84_9AGAR|nr:unnamed protein product [Mycena citricolor]